MRVREIRERQGISQEALAERCDLSRTHMSHIETGNTKGSLPVFVRICNVLHVSLDDLVCDSLHDERDAFLKEIADLTRGCTPLEIRIMADTLRATKGIMKKYGLAEEKK